MPRLGPPEGSVLPHIALVRGDQWHAGIDVAGCDWDNKAVDAYESSRRSWGVTGAAAVELCREWMVRLGATDAVVARDGVIDVCDLYSSRYLAWVESRRGNLDLQVVEQAAAISSYDGRAGLVFLAGGVFPTVQDRADALAVGLLRFDARAGDLYGANAVGRRVLTSGLVVA